MHHSQNNKSLEQAIEFFENPDKYSVEEIASLFEDENFADVYKSLLDCKYALIKENIEVPDVDKEWSRFAKKRTHSLPIRMLKFWISAAACIVFIMSGYFIIQSQMSEKETIVFRAENGNRTKGITLKTNSGEEYLLGAETSIANNILVDDDELIYSKTNGINEINELHTLTTPSGRGYKVVLEDSTTVWLSANSQLQYPVKFGKQERSVTLLGEAYFKVARNEDKPFVIKTSNTVTRVLGTELNVKDNASNSSHITLITGKIEIKSKKSNQLISIKPGEDASLLENGSFDITQIDVDYYIYSRDGYFYFDNISLKEIMENIGRWYNINVVFRNKSIMNYKMRFIGEKDKGISHNIALLNRMKKASIINDGKTLYIE